jgi:hypothetical protein
MQLVLPINFAAGAPFTNGVQLDGHTDIGFDFHVAKTLGVSLVGNTKIEFYHETLGLLLAGTTALGLALRLNNEANIFLGLHLDGSTAFEISFNRSYSGGVQLDGRTDLAVSLHVDFAEELVLTFFVDIVDTAAASALAASNRSYTGRLIVDGSVIPILRAEGAADSDKLGSEIKVVLARPDVSLISTDSVIDFQVGLWDIISSGWQWFTLLAGGKLSARGARYANQEGLPADSVEVTIADIMGDRWNLRPAVPTTLYDPQVIDPPSADDILQQTIYYDNGGSISPAFVSIAGLDLKTILNRAFVMGCGFDEVICNIKNFPVEEVTFTLEGGYDGGVRPLLKEFDPIVFVVGNSLWIVTLDLPLPAGFTARAFEGFNSESIDDSLPQGEPINSMLVRLKDTDTGDYFTEDTETYTETSGDFGTESYTETDVERRTRKYRNLSNPSVVTRVDEIYLQRRTLDFEFNEISLERTSYSYDSLNRPTGYHKTMDSRLPDPASADPSTGEVPNILQPSFEETQQIFYGPHPLYPERDCQKKVITNTSGLVLRDNDNQYQGKPYKIPLNDAHKSGYVQEGQETYFGSIKTETITLRINGGQVYRDRQVQNHVSGITEPPSTQIVPGDISFDRKRGTGRIRTVLITLPGTTTANRRVVPFDGTGLPPSIAMELAWSRLKKLNQRPREAQVSMTYMDPLMRKGADLKIRGRNDYLGTYIVRGYGWVIERDAQSGAVVARMTLNGKELPNG